MNQTALLVSILMVILIVAGVYLLFLANSQNEPIGGQVDAHGCLTPAGYSWCQPKNSCIRPFEQYCTATAPKVALFNCDGGKTITATFYPGTPENRDDKYVDLVLGDGTKISVPRAISASGARYAKADESFVFWNKGDTAFITENGTTTFSGCVTSPQ